MAVPQALSPPQPPKKQVRDILDTQEQTLFMQVFVEEVGLWMDSLDPDKHVSYGRRMAKYYRG